MQSAGKRETVWRGIVQDMKDPYLDDLHMMPNSWEAPGHSLSTITDQLCMQIGRCVPMRGCGGKGWADLVVIRCSFNLSPAVPLRP